MAPVVLYVAKPSGRLGMHSVLMMWNVNNMRFTNNQEANKYLKPFLRKGWDFKV